MHAQQQATPTTKWKFNIFESMDVKKATETKNMIFLFLQLGWLKHVKKHYDLLDVYCINKFYG